MDLLLVLHIHRGLKCPPEPLPMRIEAEDIPSSGMSLVTMLAERYHGELHVH